jgi:hypothetical protein
MALSFGATALATHANDVAVEAATRSNSFALTSRVTLADAFIHACARAGVAHNRMAGILGISPPTFAHNFGLNSPDRNPMMKLICSGYPGRSEEDEAVMRAVLTEMVVILAADLQLTIGVNHEYIDLCVAFAEAGVELMRKVAK